MINQGLPTYAIIAMLVIGIFGYVCGFFEGKRKIKRQTLGKDVQ